MLRVSPRSASANELEEAAAAIRQRRSATAARSGKPPCARHCGGTKPGQGSDLRFEHIVAQIDVLKKAIGR